MAELDTLVEYERNDTSVHLLQQYQAAPSSSPSPPCSDQSQCLLPGAIPGLQKQLSAITPLHPSQQVLDILNQNVLFPITSLRCWPSLTNILFSIISLRWCPPLTPKLVLPLFYLPTHRQPHTLTKSSRALALPPLYIFG